MTNQPINTENIKEKLHKFFVEVYPESNVVNYEDSSILITDFLEYGEAFYIQDLANYELSIENTWSLKIVEEGYGVIVNKELSSEMLLDFLYERYQGYYAPNTDSLDYTNMWKKVNTFFHNELYITNQGGN
ncbi:hypothetical protein QLX41_gp121 [Listeria phage LMTA-94]|uniref:Uncharacterized protein n=1 Tax=Listeria phage LMTA-94 TaxID=1486419 RepID=A0A068CCL3_9CAUD|nr:hypothetical protein QLX41_gp121 [Listeria phage LMTA-94]AID17277.1 hypothetical protein [Listeria phage LMTA-94]